MSSQSLVSRISMIGNRFRGRNRLDPDLQAAIELVVDVADPDIRQVGRCRKHLRAQVSVAMAYCTSLVDDLPGPVESRPLL